MYSDETMEAIHQVPLDEKLRLWEERGERNMLPAASAVFRDRGGINLYMQKGLEFFSLLIRAEKDPDTRKHMEAWAVPYVLDTAISTVMDTSDVYALPGPGTYLPRPGDVLEELWISFDGFGRMMDEEEAMATQRGDLSRDFANNPESNVKEMVSTFVYTDDLVGGANVQSRRSWYVIEDGGQMVFEPTESDVLDVGGAINDTIMRHFNGDRTVK